MSMTKAAFAIIGSNWGDEGKGLGVDALTRQLMGAGHDVLVVRSNGGAQAGHGVELPDGRRHVFSHIGSGALAGAATHLSRFFVSSPMVFGREYEALEQLDANLNITVDPWSIVTTPWDIAINQAAEIHRANGRHGSCGMGFGEAIERQVRGFSLTALDLYGHQDQLRSLLSHIEMEWMPARLAALGIDPMPEFMSKIIGNPAIAERFLIDCQSFTARISLRNDADISSDALVLFEGAQGLQLDMDYGEMPHVTRSNTGIKNMLAICEDAGISEIRPIYMTRAYATRHGAGPLPHERFGKDGSSLPLDWAEVVDLTNAGNPWQGEIRQANLDLGVLKKAISHDLDYASGRDIRVIPGLGVTCLDQIKDLGHVMNHGHEFIPKSMMLPFTIGLAVEVKPALISHGPTAKTITWTNFGKELTAVSERGPSYDL